MNRRKNGLIKKVAIFAVVAIASAIYSDKIIELAGKIPVIGDQVKKMSNQNKTV